jgi:hypothetical protein
MAAVAIAAITSKQSLLAYKEGADNGKMFKNAANICLLPLRNSCACLRLFFSVAPHSYM